MAIKHFHFLLPDVAMKAVWNGAVIAESDDTVIVEGNHYFPADSLRHEYVIDSAHHTTCPWKGIASYYSLRVGDRENRDAVSYYPSPSSLAEQVSNRIAFWKGVQISA